jgi:hypothetical protein
MADQNDAKPEAPVTFPRTDVTERHMKRLNALKTNLRAGVVPTDVTRIRIQMPYGPGDLHTLQP